LVTRPDLVKRLSALHSVVNARMELQNKLQELSGRLDLVLSQVEMRASTKAEAKPRRRVETVQYVEGDSSAEDANGLVNGDVDSEPETEEEDNGGSVEDVELGGDSEDDEDDESESESDEEGSNDGHGQMNGFIDDEAEEGSEEESAEDSQETEERESSESE